MIATFWPEPERQRYEAAARRFRHPYWDWAAPPPSGESVLPRSIGGSQFIDVNGPSGVQRIANPLFNYNFRPLDTTAFGSPVSSHNPYDFVFSLTGNDSGIPGRGHSEAPRVAARMRSRTTRWWP